MFKYQQPKTGTCVRYVSHTHEHESETRIAEPEVTLATLTILVNKLSRGLRHQFLPLILPFFILSN